LPRFDGNSRYCGYFALSKRTVQVGKSSRMGCLGVRGGQSLTLSELACVFWLTVRPNGGSPVGLR
jgi:hypothetical protein